MRNKCRNSSEKWENLGKNGEIKGKIGKKSGKEKKVRKKNFKGRCVKKVVCKAEGVCKTYDALQLKALEMLEQEDAIREIRCNVPLDGSPWDLYMTDFLCQTENGDWIAFETCFRKLLVRPQTMELLDASRNYWMKRGVKWGLIVDAEVATAAKE